MTQTFENTAEQLQVDNRQEPWFNKIKLTMKGQSLRPQNKRSPFVYKFLKEDNNKLLIDVREAKEKTKQNRQIKVVQFEKAQQEKEWKDIKDDPEKLLSPKMAKTNRI